MAGVEVVRTIKVTITEEEEEIIEAIEVVEATIVEAREVEVTTEVEEEVEAIEMTISVKSMIKTISILQATLSKAMISIITMMNSQSSNKGPTGQLTRWMQGLVSSKNSSQAMKKMKRGEMVDQAEASAEAEEEEAAEGQAEEASMTKRVTT
jgi:hypothetical protein